MRSRGTSHMGCERSDMMRHSSDMLGLLYSTRVCKSQTTRMESSAKRCGQPPSAAGHAISTSSPACASTVAWYGVLPSSKCWEKRYAFDPAAFLAGPPGAHYEWPDLRRLIRRGAAVSPEEIIRGVRQGYAFLGQLTKDHSLLELLVPYAGLRLPALLPQS